MATPARNEVASSDPLNEELIMIFPFRNPVSKRERRRASGGGSTLVRMES